MKELLIKYINGDCTDQEKIRITHWLDSDPENMKEYLALRKLQDISIWNLPAENKFLHSITKKDIPSSPFHRFYMESLKVAAVFLIALLVSRYLIFIPDSPDSFNNQTIYVPAGQRVELTMEDGTKVWLNSKTTFTYPGHFSDQEREVSLDGEGYFEVAHNKSKPFIVKANEYRVKVLGTDFNIMAYSGRKSFETSLLNGSVEILTKKGNNGVILQPDEKAFLKDGTLHIEPITDKNHLLWKDGIIGFDDVTFEELISSLELYFDVKIEVKTKQAFKSRVTGKFRAKDGVEHILKVLQLKNNFTYTRNDDLNIITIK